jgi:hypothetical protein
MVLGEGKAGGDSFDAHPTLDAPRKSPGFGPDLEGREIYSDLMQAR